MQYEHVTAMLKGMGLEEAPRSLKDLVRDHVQWDHRSYEFRAPDTPFSKWMHGSRDGETVLEALREVRDTGFELYHSDGTHRLARMMYELKLDRNEHAEIATVAIEIAKGYVQDNKVGLSVHNVLGIPFKFTGVNDRFPDESAPSEGTWLEADNLNRDKVISDLRHIRDVYSTRAAIHLGWSRNGDVERDEFGSMGMMHGSALANKIIELLNNVAPETKLPSIPRT